MGPTSPSSSSPATSTNSMTKKTPPRRIRLLSTNVLICWKHWLTKASARIRPESASTTRSTMSRTSTTMPRTPRVSRLSTSRRKGEEPACAAPRISSSLLPSILGSRCRMGWRRTLGKSTRGWKLWPKIS